jgi:hypothetical protein
MGLGARIDSEMSRLPRGTFVFKMPAALGRGPLLHGLAWILSLLLFCSCATAYRPLKGGTGYSSSQVASNEFRVRFQGNADTSLERAYDFALLRSAELTLQNGFRFFSVLDVTNTSSAKRYTRVYQTFGTPVAGAEDFGRYDYIPAPPRVQVQQPEIFYKPGTVFLIKCYAKPPEKNFAYDAVVLEESLRRKYKMP